MHELDKIAEEIYDYCNANRKDNLNKDDSPGNPRKVGCEYKYLFEGAKHFYRSVAKWHLDKLEQNDTKLEYIWPSTSLKDAVETLENRIT